jgi:RNA recognition motif-containing protein
MKKGINGRLRSNGLACVTLTTEDAVATACEELDGVDVLGRPLIVRLDKFEKDALNYNVLEGGSDHADVDRKTDDGSDS